MITKAPRGTKDWFGKEVEQRTDLEGIFRELCASCNIHEIITPVFEHTELFQRGVGETTDVVQKEMYTFLDKESGYNYLYDVVFQVHVEIKVNKFGEDFLFASTLIQVSTG